MKLFGLKPFDQICGLVAEQNEIMMGGIGCEPILERNEIGHEDDKWEQILWGGTLRHNSDRRIFQHLVA